MNAVALIDMATDLARIERRIRNNEQRDRTIVHSDDNKAFDYRCALEDQSTETVREAVALAEGKFDNAHAILEDELTRRAYAGEA